MTLGSGDGSVSLWDNILYLLRGALLGVRVFITNVKGTFLGMSESEEASKRR